MTKLLLATIALTTFAATAHAGCADPAKAAEDAVRAHLAPMVCGLSAELEPAFAQRGATLVYRVNVNNPCSLGSAPSNAYDVEVISEREGGNCSTKIIGE